MRGRRAVVLVGVVAMVAILGLGSSASAAKSTSAKSGGAKTESGRITGPEHFEVYAVQFGQSFAPIIWTGVFTTGGFGYKHIAPGTDRALFPDGSFTISHPTLTQDTATRTFNEETCVLQLTGKAPYTLSDGQGKYRGIRGEGEVSLNVRVFFRHSPTGCFTDDPNEPPISYIELANGTGTVSLPRSFKP
jgi:hypothetical protein